MKELFAFTEKHCPICTTITFHRCVFGDGCRTSTCVDCERRYDEARTGITRQENGGMHTLQL